MTRETLDKLRSMGMNLGPQYDMLADLNTKSRKDDADNATITNIQVKTIDQKDKINKYFAVRVELNASDYVGKVELEIDGKIFQAFQKSPFFERFAFYTDVYIDFSTGVRLEENFKLTARLIDFAGKPQHSTSINVKVKNSGKVGVTNDEIEDVNNSKIDVVSTPTISITLDQLKAFGVSKKKAEEYFESLNKTLQDYKIDTDLKIIHFLAQIIHESISLTATSERGKKDSDYNGFKGRGFMQLTGKNNYEEYEDYEGENFTSSTLNKQKLENAPYAIRSAGWFWTINAKLNELAEENDFIFITKKINGGYNHFDDRLKILKKGFKIFQINFNDYIFKNSKAYNDEKAAFGWGLWHDPLLNKVGFIKNKEIAIEGYKRYLELAPNGKHTNWYKILSINNFITLKYKKNGVNKVNVIDVVNKQLKELQEL